MTLSARVVLTVAFLATVFVSCYGRRRRGHFDGSTNHCPKITVQKQTIIRTTYSTANGGRLLHKTPVESARECYSLCCRKKDCDTGIMRYSREEPRQMCFLFYCGFPNRCGFVAHDSYAVIHFKSPNTEENLEYFNEETDYDSPKDKPADIQEGSPQPDMRSIHEKQLATEEPRSRSSFKVKHITESIPQPVPTRQRLPEEKCPDGAPMAMCADDPCAKECPAFPNAKCRPSFCGGCYAKFFDANMEEVNCEVQADHSRKSEEMHSTRPQKDYSISNDKNTKKGTSSNRKDKTKNVNEEVVVVNVADGGGLPTDETPVDGEDIYAVKNYREWLDGPRKGQKRKFLKPTSKPEGYVASNITGHNGSENNMPTSKPKREILNNPFSLPLMIAMLVCLIALTAVVWKMRCNKLGKKGKKFAVDDGDYLINGMYL